MLRKFSAGVVLYNLFVIIFGAWVRITGSGAGCGAHWPTCNGEIMPRSPGIATVIEFTHRLTSGLSLILVVALVIWVFRATRKGHRARSSALAMGVFILLEAIIGAGLVIFHLVEKDSSVARAVIIAIHLVNTLGLLGAGALTTFFVSGDREKASPGSDRAWLYVALASVAIVCATGAITALGDTLFPVHGGVVDESHFLVRLRIVHPFVAVATAIILTITSRKARIASDLPATQTAGKLLVAFTHTQVLIGVANILLRAPGWMQLVHLCVANLVWLALVSVCATRFYR